MIKVEVFTSPTCPHCPAAIKLASEIAKKNPEVELEIVNVWTNPQKAVDYGIYAVPTIVVNGKVTFIGAPRESEFIKAIEKAAKENK